MNFRIKTCYTRDELLIGISNILLFLFSFRFLNKNITFLLLYVLTCLFFSIWHKSISISKECLVLTAYGTLYYLVRRNWGLEGTLTNLLTLALGAPLMYMSGRKFLEFSKNKEGYYKKVLLVLSVGMFLFAMLSYFKNGIVFDYENSADVRAIPDIWTNELWQATNINGYCVLSIIVSMVLILQKAKGIKFISMCVMFVGSIYLTLITASRTNLFIVGLVLLIYMGLTIMMKKVRYIERNELQKKYIKIIFVGFFIFFVLFNYQTIVKILPIDAFLERLSNRDLSLAEDGRWEMWKTVIFGLRFYFWGNNTSIHLAHNLFLDVAREAGVIAMILLIIYIAMVIITSIKLLLNDKLSINIRILNFILIISLVSSFMIEPVMNAKPFIFIAFCMISGMQYELNKTNRIKIL